MASNRTLYRILTSIGEEEFIKQAWIELAREDAPIDVFKEDFGDVLTNKHEVCIETVEISASYHASVGYNRQEPYIDYETYYENQPYLATESYYDSASRTTRQRQVTKYKKVAKQRQVTRYKTVTDWSSFGSSITTRSTAMAENMKGVHLNDGMFLDGIRSIDLKKDVEAICEFETRSETDDALNAKHIIKLEDDIARALPGDRYRDMSYNIDSASTVIGTVYECDEYSTLISYKGENYLKHGYPFGKMTLGGKKIPNEQSAEVIKEKKRSELELFKKKQKDSVDGRIWSASKLSMLAALALLLASLVISVFVRVTWLIIAMYILALGAFVLSKVVENSNAKKIKKDVDANIKAETERTERECAEYAVFHKKEVLDALNKKLAALGFKPVDASEL